MQDPPANKQVLEFPKSQNGQGPKPLSPASKPVNLKNIMAAPRIDTPSAITNLALNLSSVQREIAELKQADDKIAQMVMALLQGHNKLVEQLTAQGTLVSEPPAPGVTPDSAPKES